MARVTLRDVRVVLAARARRRAPAVEVLRGVDLDVGDGEMVVVVGASGAGKTTLLRVVAGLDPVAAGSVLMDGADVTAADPGTRDVAMVFQYPRLLPDRNVGRNVAFPLEVRQQTAEEIRTRVGAEARALHIEALLERSPEHLSVGEAQLVQIARALVRVPAVLLLDEPLARLDAQVRERMRRELRMLQQGYGVTTLVTTNDWREAMALSDRLVVLDEGRVVQTGAPMDVYREPVSLVAAHLTGPVATTVLQRDGRRVVRVERPDGERWFFDEATGARLG